MKRLRIAVILCLTLFLQMPILAEDSAVVSKECDPSEAKFKWTLERMLMATPMPMTAQGRKFIQTHKSLETIQTWSLKEFKNYGQSDYARNWVSGEAVRWRGTAEMLRKQVARASEFLKLKPPQVSRLEPKWQTVSSNELEAMLKTDKVEAVFHQMKTWRKEIAVLAPRMEKLREIAKQRGVSEQLEQSVD